jgi:hypothetical protein
MGSMKISGTITLAAACLIAGASATRAETRYFWNDAEGEHYTRDKPRMVTPYTQVSIPDTVAWRSPPAHADGSTEGAALPAQDLFKKVAPSVYWVRSDPTGIRGSSRYGSAIAVSDQPSPTATSSRRPMPASRWAGADPARRRRRNWWRSTSTRIAAS